MLFENVQGFWMTKLQAPSELGLDAVIPYNFMQPVSWLRPIDRHSL